MNAEGHECRIGECPGGTIVSKANHKTHPSHKNELWHTSPVSFESFETDEIAFLEMVHDCAISHDLIMESNPGDK